MSYTVLLFLYKEQEKGNEIGELTLLTPNDLQRRTQSAL
jgi:hypothetical protein